MRARLLVGIAILLAALGCSSVPDYPMAIPCTNGDGGSCPPPTVVPPDGGPWTVGTGGTTASGTTTSTTGDGGV